jgi:hypothetical protein
MRALFLLQTIDLLFKIFSLLRNFLTSASISRNLRLELILSSALVSSSYHFGLERVNLLCNPLHISRVFLVVWLRRSLQWSSNSWCWRNLGGHDEKIILG